MRHYAITYSRVTPESAEAGDFSEAGFYQEKTELDPEEWLYELRYLIRMEGFYYPSHSGPPTLRTWYSTPWSTIDYQTGEEEERSLHLSGDWTQEELEQVYKEVRG